MTGGELKGSSKCKKIAAVPKAQGALLPVVPGSGLGGAGLCEAVLAGVLIVQSLLPTAGVDVHLHVCAPRRSDQNGQLAVVG